MQYLLVGEKYDRGPGGLLKIEFEAADDNAALLKMCTMAFIGDPAEIQPLTTFDEIQALLMEEVFDDEDVETIDMGNEKAFLDLTMEIFEDANGDGMDFYASLTNTSTGETIWDSGDPTDYELEYDDEEGLF